MKSVNEGVFDGSKMLSTISENEKTPRRDTLNHNRFHQDSYDRYLSRGKPKYIETKQEESFIKVEEEKVEPSILSRQSRSMDLRRQKMTEEPPFEYASSEE